MWKNSKAKKNLRNCPSSNARCPPSISPEQNCQRKSDRPLFGFYRVLPNNWSARCNIFKTDRISHLFSEQYLANGDQPSSLKQRKQEGEKWLKPERGQEELQLAQFKQCKGNSPLSHRWSIIAAATDDPSIGASSTLGCKVGWGQCRLYNVDYSTMYSGVVGCCAAIQVPLLHCYFINSSANALLFIYYLLLTMSTTIMLLLYVLQLFNR